ncbi:MAG: phosphoribosylformylglycinamidine synthase I [Candidatus Omnitrophica bacterium]|nr:phosphoribosylformylglycinamidine synthase I [Candidatus Omnitrophota bacterium]MBU1933503.1 phosphoribosylformylglycinamidine synthase I [Candidatus Omnitrophota bacterium]
MVKSPKVKVIVLRTAGTNCDVETADAFTMCGASADLVHINELARSEKSLNDYQIFAIPGGFTYGDDIASGKILANEVRYRLGGELKKFIDRGKLIIGICNGFQVLVKSGILPGASDKGLAATLTFNDSGKFEARWVYLGSSLACPERSRGKPRVSRCVWTKGIKKIIYLPVAHGEGKFITKDKSILRSLRRNNQIVFQYVDEKGRLAEVYPDNPNGSVDSIAGICDLTGRVLGMMPHPERHVFGTHHPRWTREGLKRFGDGLSIFQNGVNYVKTRL